MLIIFLLVLGRSSIILSSEYCRASIVERVLSSEEESGAGFYLFPICVDASFRKVDDTDRPKRINKQQQQLLLKVPVKSKTANR